MSSTINGLIYYPSTRKDKKLMVNVNGKWIHFGNSNYQHFFDKTGLLDKKLNHKDIKRRLRYLKRAKGIKYNNGKFTYSDINSPNYHSINILW